MPRLSLRPRLLPRNYREPALQFFPRVGLLPRLIFRTFLAVIIAYVLLVSATAVSIYHYKADTPWNRTMTHIFPYPAFVVGGEVVSVRRVWLETDAFQFNAQKTHDNRYGGANTRGDIQKFVVAQITDRILYKQALSAHKITISSQSLDTLMQSIYKDAGGQDKFITYLQENYGPTMTLQNFEDWVGSESLYETAVKEQILTQATVRHIMVAVASDASADQIANAKQKLVDIRAKITTPDQFPEIAKQYSEDIASRDKGGDLGTTIRGTAASQFSQDFENAIFTLPINEVSQPIRTPFGWHLVQVEKRVGDVDKNIDDYTSTLRSSTHMKFFI